MFHAPELSTDKDSPQMVGWYY